MRRGERGGRGGGKNEHPRRPRAAYYSQEAVLRGIAGRQTAAAESRRGKRRMVKQRHIAPQELAGQGEGPAHRGHEDEAPGKEY